MGANLERPIDAAGTDRAVRTRDAEPRDSKTHDAGIPLWLRIGGTVLRTLFLCVLLVLTVRVSVPQNEYLSTIYDTPADVVRLLLGLVLCVALVVHLFKLPEDAESYRTWLYFGLFAVPFACIFAVAVW